MEEIKNGIFDVNKTYIFFVIEREDVGYSSFWEMVEPVMIETDSYKNFYEVFAEMWDAYYTDEDCDWDLNYHFKMMDTPLEINSLDTVNGSVVFSTISVGG